MTNTYRLFIAIELPDQIIQALSTVQDQLRAARPVRWTPKNHLHLTLQFLGDTPVTQVDPLVAALAHRLHGHAPFSLTATGLGVFPSLKRPRVIWVGLGGDLPGLTHLQAEVVKASQPLGFEPESRPFKPHLTLGRVNNRAGGGDYARLAALIEQRQAALKPLGRFAVNRVSLIRSQLKPGGAVYTVLATVRLGQV